MQTILPPSGNTIKILGKARSAEHGLRWMTYVLAQPVEGGVLVFHTLTRALLLLTPEEYAAPDNLPELRSSWFRVPQEMDDMKYADQVRFIRRTMWKEPEHITSYTIFTTTDCNARCFYCYEMGRSRIPMSAETAHKAAAFGDEDRAQDENAIYNALKIACADDFVRRLENGLDTVLGERGAGLSEGQMQRIAIARAVYLQPLGFSTEDPMFWSFSPASSILARVALVVAA